MAGTPSDNTGPAHGDTAEAKHQPAAAASQDVTDAPDPDIDDLDDLDDVLDEFSAASINPKPSASGPGRPAPDAGPAPAASSSAKAAPDLNSDPEASVPSDADFAAQLQKEMANLMGEIDESPEMRSQLRDVMAELNQHAGEALQPAADGAKPAAAAGADAAFQDTIQRTMERMQASGERASAAETADGGGAEGGGGEGELLSQLLQEMARTGEGAGGEEEFSKMLLGMMEQLTNRDILYEPMKELHGKFPDWMRKNEGKGKEEDMKRYKEQQRLVAEIVGRYDREGYRDEDEQDREYIVERMQKMQAAGNPPADLVGDMKEAQDLLGDPEGGCAPQ